MAGKPKRAWPVALAFLLLLGLLVASPFLTLRFSERWSHWQNRELINRSFERRLVPAASWVKTFLAREHRLPTDDEMRSHCSEAFGDDVVAIYRERPRWMENWGVAGQDFMLCDSIPEWNLYYCSWDHRRIEAWSD
jgi:hypothetical protein